MTTTTSTPVVKVHTSESIKALLETSSKAVEKGILVIYDRQTQDEKTTESTNHQNGVGFSGADAEILSSFAAQILRKQSRGIELGKCLSEKQMAIAKKKIARYSRQLAEVANEKLGLTSKEAIKEALKAAKVAEAPKVEVKAEKAPEVKASLGYWIMTPSKGWKASSEAEAQAYLSSLQVEISRRGHSGKVASFKAISEMVDGDFSINYQGQLLQAMEAGIVPDSTEWAIKVARTQFKKIGMTEAQIEVEIKRIIRVAAEKEAAKKAEESLNLEREMWEMEAQGDREGTIRDEKAKFEARKAMETSGPPSIASSDFKSAKAKITDWLLKS